MKPMLPAAIVLAAALAACASDGRGYRPDGHIEAERGADSGPAGRIVVPGGLLLASFDADGDYRVTPAEVAAGAARAFEAADRDGDGQVSLIELGDWREVALGDATALPGPYAYDSNQNGAITPAEFARALQDLADGVADESGAAPFAALTQARPNRFSREGERGDGRLAPGEAERRSPSGNIDGG